MISMKNTKGGDPMRSKYFTGCTTAESIKKRYRELVKANHPDFHMNEFEKYNVIMGEINAEYDEVFNRYKNNHAESDSSENASEAARHTECPEEFRKIINSVIHCDGCNVEIVGSWVWVSGNTYAHKDTLKAAGFKWAGKKQAWYWHSPEEAVGRRSKMTLDQIKEKYGCQSFTTSARKQLA